MVDPTTVNKFLNQPSSGSDVGTWGDSINANMDLIDAAFGNVATIAISSLSVALSSTEYVCSFIKLTGAMSANISILFPSVGSFYTIINDTTNSSNFFITASTTMVGSQVIGLPPNTMTDIMTSSNKVRFRGLPHVGSYWDYAGTTTPSWLTACTVPPWLYCNGGTFSSATYPNLAVLIGGSILPDHRGRQGYNINDGTGRITISGGIDGNTRFAAGGVQSVSLSTLNLPSLTWPYIDPGHTHNIVVNNAHAGGQIFDALSNATGALSGATITVDSAATGLIGYSGGSNTPFSVAPPAAISGLRFIRAA